MASSSLSSKNLDSIQSTNNQLTHHNQSLAFQLKCGLELEKLQIQLRNKLRDDLLKLQTEAFYADVKLISEDDRESRTHLSLIRVRTPEFYNYVVTNGVPGIQQQTIKLPNVNHCKVQSFLRLVYSSENIRDDETCFLKLLLQEQTNKRSKLTSDCLVSKYTDRYHYSFKQATMNQDIVDSSISQAENNETDCNGIEERGNERTECSTASVSYAQTCMTDSISDTSSSGKNVICFSVEAESSSEVARDDELLPHEPETVAMVCDRFALESDAVVIRNDAETETIECPIEERVETTSRHHSVSSSSSPSPVDSLRKDDSLEFCPDSLASDDALICASFTPSGDQHHTGGGATGDKHRSSDVEATLSSASPMFSDSVSAYEEYESIRKRSWTLTGEMPVKNPLFVDRRSLSLGGDDSLKPSAIVTPYNATNDALNVDGEKRSCGASEGSSYHASASSSLLRNEQPRVQFEVVPFLKEVAVGNLQEMSCTGEQNTDGLFAGGGDAASNSVRCSSNEITATTGGAVNKKHGFFMFIDTTKDSEEPEMEPGVESSSCSNEMLAKHDVAVVESVSTPPPVYMFIDVASDTSVKQSKEVEKPTVQRRRDKCNAVPRKRPKSESSVTLLKNAPRTERAAKRISQVLDVRSDVECKQNENVCSLDEETIKSYYGPCSKLGEDLLNMFLNEVDSDITVRVAGRDIKAHKSILISRCGYFAAMLSGGWVESSGNFIKLQGFTYDAVHFAMCHIYSGASSVPANVDISELASLADMFGLEGLKDVVTLYLKMNYCHFFHKPCSSCTTGVSECLLIAISFGLDELQEKCLKWIIKHMIRTWQTKSFAALPSDILHRCLNVAKFEVTVDTVLDAVMRCDKLMATLPHVKWTDPVLALVASLAETCSEFLSKHFAKVLMSNSFLVLRYGDTWNLHALEATFLLAVERLSLDVASRAYAHLNAHLELLGQLEHSESSDVNENFEELVRKIHRQVELLLIHNANQVAQCPGWALLSSKLQKIIMDAAVIVIEFEKPTAPPPRLSSFNKRFTRSAADNRTLLSPSAISRKLSASCSSATSKTTNGQQPLKIFNKSSKKPASVKFSEPSKDIRKSSTLPRSSGVCKDVIPTRSSQQSIIKASSAFTLPKSSNSMKEGTGAAGVRVLRNVNTQPPAATCSQKRVQSATVASMLPASTSSRPRSWPVNKEASKLKCLVDSPSTVPHRKKAITAKEPRKVLREAAPTTTTATTTATANKRSSSSYSSAPLLARPKSIVIRSNEDSQSGTARPSTSNENLRTKSNKMLKATLSDVQSKDSKCENHLKATLNNRPKCDFVASSSRRISSSKATTVSKLRRSSAND